MQIMRVRRPKTSVLLTGILASMASVGCIVGSQDGLDTDDADTTDPEMTDPATTDPSASIGATTAKVDFKPQTILGPGVPATGFDQNVVSLGSLSLPMTNTQTAYVVAVMRVNSATGQNSYDRTLFDNEVVCKDTHGWSQNFVVGQNVYKKGSGSPEWEDVTLTTRFLIHPGAAGTVTCTAYIRTASLSYADSTVRLVSGYLRVADTSIDNAVDGKPIQSSVSSLAAIDQATPTVRVPATDYFELGPGATGLSVFGDIEYQTCVAGRTCNQTASKAQFTLIVNQWKADGTLCQTDTTTTVTKSFPYRVHHAFVPLNKSNFKIRTDSGCIPRFNAYIKVTWLGGEPGGVQGIAKGLPDGRYSTSKHDSGMSHIFVVPY